MLVTPAVAPHLRRGLLKQMGVATERLSALATGGEIGDRRGYESALWTIDATRKVLAKIGDRAPESPSSVVLLRDDHPYIVYKALKSQLAAGGRAGGEAAEGGRPRAASSELAAAVSVLLAAISHSATAKREAKLSGAPARERVIAPPPTRRGRAS